MKSDTPNILLVNPWIHDFAAYDFWAKPMGLLYLASILRSHGFTMSYIDCLDRFHPSAPPTDPYARYGRGPYLKNRISKPKGLEDVLRTFSRYGIKPHWLKKDLLSIHRPDLILVTSLMTYWYPGVQETIRVIKGLYPDVPLLLGGTYPGLCYDHAVKHSGADRVISGPGEEQILKLVAEATGYSITPEFDTHDLDALPYPAFDLQTKITYIPIRTSIGCPFSCTYCASHILNPKRYLRNPESVVAEIRYWHETHEIRDFIFYDDALLIDAERHAIPILDKILSTGLKVRFHTPNAVHIRGISVKTATMMFRSGFKTLRLGLETALFEKRNGLDEKVTADEFDLAATCLKNAGFTKNQIGAYLLAGLPEQSISSIENSINMVKESDITPILAYYSPIPGTTLWKKAVDSSRYDLESDPVFSNNAIFPCHDQSFSWETISHLKSLANR